MILNISEAANIGIHATIYLAQHSSDEPVTASEMSENLKVSEAHLIKVLQRLKKTGLAQSTRGPRGGYKLAQDTKTIRLMDVFNAIDGEMDCSNCMLSHQACTQRNCAFGTLLGDVNSLVSNYFVQTTIADLAGKECLPRRG